MSICFAMIMRTAAIIRTVFSICMCNGLIKAPFSKLQFMNNDEIVSTLEGYELDAGEILDGGALYL